MKNLTAEMYVEIFKDVIRNVDDYGDKNAVRKHNKAYAKIDKLINKIKKDKEYLKQLFGELLKNKDEKIILNISAKCLEFNVLTQQAIMCLNNLRNSKTLSGLDKMGIDIILKKH